MKEDMTDWMRAIYLGQYSFRSLEEAFRSAWDAGAAAERERNAQIADAHASVEGIAQLIAAEIRGQK